MNSQRQIKSFWWVPGQPEKRWFGTLTLGADQTPELELFIERQNPEDVSGALGRVIHGKDEHGHPITLLHAGSGGSSVSGAVIKRRVQAGFALLGIELNNVNEFTAHSLRFQLQHLYGWLGRSGFVRDAATAGSIEIKFQHQQDEWHAITTRLQLGIHHTFNTQNGFQKRSVAEDAAFTFKSVDGLSFERCWQLLGAMRTLLHFASLKTVYPVWMTAYKDGHGYHIGDHWVDQDIAIESSNLRAAESEHPLPDRWVFRYDDVCAYFATFIRDWLDYNEKFSEALGSYSCTIYHPLTAELCNLSLTQALESYHGIKFASHHKREFKDKIEELANQHIVHLKGLVDDAADFAEHVLCTRNYYTHHNPKWLATGKVLTQGNLVRMNEKLRLIFQMCVLDDLQIPSDRFRRLRRQIASEIIDYW